MSFLFILPLKALTSWLFAQRFCQAHSNLAKRRDLEGWPGLFSFLQKVLGFSRDFLSQDAPGPERMTTDGLPKMVQDIIVERNPG